MMIHITKYMKLICCQLKAYTNLYQNAGGIVGEVSWCFILHIYPSEFNLCKFFHFELTINAKDISIILCKERIPAVHICES